MESMMINTKPQSYTLAARHKSSFKAGRQSKKMWVKIIIVMMVIVMLVDMMMTMFDTMNDTTTA